MEIHNFQNIEQYKEEERTNKLRISDQISYNNSCSSSPQTTKVNNGDQPTIGFQLWLKENLEDFNNENLDVAEQLQHYLSDHSDNQPVQRAFSLDLSQNRVVQDRLHQALNLTVIQQDFTITLSSSRSLSMISEESQVLYSKDSIQLTKTAQNSIQKEIIAFLKQDTTQSLKNRNNSFNDVLDDKIPYNQFDQNQAPQSEQQLDGNFEDQLPPLIRSITSPRKTSSKTRNQALIQNSALGGVNLSLSQQIPSPKSSSRRKKTNSRNSTISYEEIYQNIYQKGIVRKAFVKTSKRKISQSFIQQITKKSQLSFDMKRSVSSKAQSCVQAIKVSYFTSKLIKKFTVPKEMTAGEFIYKALKTYRLDSASDQSLLKYPTNPLAYRLESTDEYLLEEEDREDSNNYRFRAQHITLIGRENSKRGTPINQRKTSSELSKVQLQFIKVFPKDYNVYSDSDLEEMIDRIVLAPEAPINFSLIFLVENDIMVQKLQGLLLKGITIIEIEDPQLQETYHIEAQQQTMGELMDQINRQYPGLYNRQDHCLRLKFPCLSFADQMLPEKLTVQSLPINQLEIVNFKLETRFRDYEFNVFKPQLQSKATKVISLKETSVNQSEYLKLSQLVSPSNNKTLFHHQRDHFDEAHRMKMYPTLYSYEEFDLLRVVGQKTEPVTLALDFFDFYYIHKDQRTKSHGPLKKRINHFFKKVLQFLLEDYHKNNNQYTKFPLQMITDYSLEDGQLKIKYSKNENERKLLIFQIDPLFIKYQKTEVEDENNKQIIEKGKSKLQAIYGKITFLMEQNRYPISFQISK